MRHETMNIIKTHEKHHINKNQLNKLHFTLSEFLVYHFPHFPSYTFMFPSFFPTSFTPFSLPVTVCPRFLLVCYLNINPTFGNYMRPF